MTRKGKQSETVEVDQPWRCTFHANHGRCGLVAGIYPLRLEKGPEAGDGKCSFHYGLNWKDANKPEVFDGFCEAAKHNEPDSVWGVYPSQALWECAQGKTYFERYKNDAGYSKYRLVRP